MKSSTADLAFLARCILEGGAIRDLAMFAVDNGWSARRFRVSCEFALLRTEKTPDR